MKTKRRLSSSAHLLFFEYLAGQLTLGIKYYYDKLFFEVNIAKLKANEEL